MESKIVKITHEVALSVSIDKVPAWCLVSEINQLLRQSNINAKFTVSQQNRYNHDGTGEGTLLTGVFNDCEKGN